MWVFLFLVISVVPQEFRILVYQCCSNKHNRLSSLIKQQRFLFHTFGDWKYKIQVPAVWFLLKHCSLAYRSPLFCCVLTFSRASVSPIPNILRLIKQVSCLLLDVLQRWYPQVYLVVSQRNDVGLFCYNDFSEFVLPLCLRINLNSLSYLF